MRFTEMPMMTNPRTTSISCQKRNSRTLAMSWESTGLVEGEVQGALADLVHQALHVGLDPRTDDAAHEDEDAHHHQQLGLAPAVQLVGVVEDQGQPDQANRQGNRAIAGSG